MQCTVHYSISYYIVLLYTTHEILSYFIDSEFPPIAKNRIFACVTIPVQECFMLQQLAVQCTVYP